VGLEKNTGKRRGKLIVENMYRLTFRINVLMLKQMVHIVTTVIQNANGAFSN
jgi:hypothetical protein